MKAPLQPGKSFGSAASSTTTQRKGGLKTITDNRPTMVAQRKLQAGVAQRLVYDKSNSTVYAPEEVMNLPGARLAKYKEGLEVILRQDGLKLETKQTLGTRLNGLKETSLKYAGREVFQGIYNQLIDSNNVYTYKDQYTWISPDASKPTPVMALADMSDITARVPDALENGQACVLQTLNSIGKAVPGSNSTSVKDHHNYCLDKALDYRTDADYLKLYVKEHNMPLVHSGTAKPLSGIPWEKLGGAGKYAATTYPNGEGGIGHMVMIEVDNNFNPTVTDKQGVTKKAMDSGTDVLVKYIFRA